MVVFLLLAVVLNFDALSIGLSYGMRGIRLPLFSLLFLSASSVVYAVLAEAAGHLFLQQFPTTLVSLIGASVLLVIGILTLHSAFGDNTDYDFDRSNSINFAEGAALALALSLDAVGTAFSLNAEVPFVFPCLIGLCQFLFLLIGKKAGAHLASVTECSACALHLISGVILIFLAFMRLLL
ncbi:MAG: manganese efflux pump [Oscillospiraceae bacterium]|nr:manganese efflux pump [Oscillospiraceae bacterium]